MKWKLGGRLMLVLGIVVVITAAGFFWIISIYDQFDTASPAHTDLAREFLEPVLGELTENLTVVRINHDNNGYYFVINDCTTQEVLDKIDEAGLSYETKRSPGHADVFSAIPSEELKVALLVFEQFDDETVYGGAALFDELTVNETKSFWSSYERNKDYAR